MNPPLFRFVKSSSTLRECPESRIAECAFIGRSNVGKSSLINALAGNKNLAKTSSRPGKTQLINHFLVGQEWHLVDLPGYGYAKRSKTEIERISKRIEQYLYNREQLVCTYVLIDLRHTLQRIDLEFINKLGEHQIPLKIVFTKADKLSKSKVEPQKNSIIRELEEFWQTAPEYFITSSEKGLGLEELFSDMDSICKEINANYFGSSDPVK